MPAQDKRQFSKIPCEGCTSYPQRHNAVDSPNSNNTTTFWAKLKVSLFRQTTIQKPAATTTTSTTGHYYCYCQTSVSPNTTTATNNDSSTLNFNIAGIPHPQANQQTSLSRRPELTLQRTGWTDLPR